MRSKPRWLRALCRSREPVYIVNEAQRIVCWNESTKKLLGYSEAEVLNQPCYQIIGGTVCGKSWCHAGCPVQRSAKRGLLLQHVEMQVRTRSGNKVCLNTSVFTVERKGRRFTIHLLCDMTRQEYTKVALESFLDTLHAYGVPNGNQEPASNPGPYKPSLPSPLPPAVAKLTRREIQVLELLARGLSAKDVSQQLVISRFTVRRHIESILLKTSVHTQAQAVAYAYRTGLL